VPPHQDDGAAPEGGSGDPSLLMTIWKVVGGPMAEVIFSTLLVYWCQLRRTYMPRTDRYISSRPAESADILTLVDINMANCVCVVLLGRYWAIPVIVVPSHWLLPLGTTS
jgi:hypothetical protein